MSLIFQYLVYILEFIREYRVASRWTHRKRYERFTPNVVYRPGGVNYVAVRLRFER